MFTNYLMHSLILTTVIRACRLGLYGQIPRALQALFVIRFQPWFSPWWLERYRFGARKRICQSLTNWRLQPFRKAWSRPGGPRRATSRIYSIAT